MMDNKLGTYISIIGNGLVIPGDDYIGEKDNKLIYKLIATFSVPDKTSVSNKFIKKLINKLRITSPVVKEKTDKYRYIVKQEFNQNKLLIIEYTQGELKDRYKDTEDK